MVYWGSVGGSLWAAASLSGLKVGFAGWRPADA